jgi:hypothetical protein
MLTFTNSLLETLTDQTALVQGNATGAVITLDYYLRESNTSLPFQAVYAMLNWNDGSAPWEYPRQVQPLHIDASKLLRNGQYYVTVMGRNYVTPHYEIVMFTLNLTIFPNYTIDNPPFYIYGPILPRDTGSPNRDTWLFDIGSDIKILESSVKMLLKTKKGERVMEPQYGTNLQQLLFENDPKTVIGLATQEIISGLARWESRVGVLSVDATNNGDRSVTLSLVLLSKISQQSFQVNMVYEK